MALRIDLFDNVLKAYTDAGFQDEKYRALCLPITWKYRELEELLDLRVAELVRHRYTNEPVGYRDILPNTLGKTKERTISYMLDRTLLRPRDIITFFNICMNRAENEPVIPAKTVLSAEAEYSQGRLRSLADEWSEHYPHLIALCKVLQQRPADFTLGEISEDTLLDVLCVVTREGDTPKPGEDSRLLSLYYEGQIKAPTLRTGLAQILYKVGVIGLKTSPYRPVLWSQVGPAEVAAAEICDETRVHVHKILWRALGIIA